jgi:hypothetical protein
MLLYILAAIVIYILFFYETDKETFVGDGLSKDLISFLQPTTTFSEYIDFLVKSNNKSYKLLKQDTFYELKFLKRENNLTQKSIKPFMDDL